MEHDRAGLKVFRANIAAEEAIRRQPPVLESCVAATIRRADAIRACMISDAYVSRWPA